jgi:phosphate-selective porin OprO/OprP
LKANQDQWFASGYFTGSPYGAQASSLLNGEQLSTVGRLAGHPYYDSDWNVQLDFSGEYVFKPAINLTGTTSNVNQHTFNLQDRPEDRAADQNRLISTGNLPINTVGVYGGEMGINWRNFLVGGYYHIGEDQQKLVSQPAPHLDFHGGYVEGGWVLTGEPSATIPVPLRGPDPKSQVRSGLQRMALRLAPEHWEIGARWSVMNLNSHVTPGVSQSVTGGVFGGLQQIFGVNLSWYPNDWVRFYLQFQYSQIDKLNSAGTAEIGQHFETLAGRMQVAF